MSMISSSISPQTGVVESGVACSSGNGRPIAERVFLIVARGMIVVVSVIFALLFLHITFRGTQGMSLQLFLGFPSRSPEHAGILPALVGSIALLIGTVLISVPCAIGTAIFLEEYSPPPRLARLMELNLITLAGTPSILFGLLGLHFFVRQAGMGRSILAASLTLALLVLPVVITVAREAIRQVPVTIREAALALGATRWKTVIHHVLPAAMPAMVTGCFLAFARVIGETAPLLAIGAYAYIGFLPVSPSDSFTALPLQVFSWLNRPQESFHSLAASAIVILMAIVVVLNFVSWSVRYFFRQQRI